MRVAFFILIAIFFPALLVPILLYLGVAHVMKRNYMTPYGVVKSLVYRALQIGFALFLCALFIETIKSGDGAVALILLILVSIVVYRGGFFSRNNAKSNFNAALPSLSFQNQSTVSTGRDYEMFIKSLVIEQGWGVIMTAQSGDQGADLIAERNGITVAIQCKWLSRGRVGNSAVQEVFSALAYYNCMYGCVVTNSDYTNPSIDLAQSTGIALLHHDELPRFLLDVLSEQGETVEIYLDVKSL